LAGLGPAPGSEQLLGLKICDPAMGAGAFLLEVVRVLGEALLAAWEREDRPNVTLGAARLAVACRCIRGVDTDPIAVELARRSIYLLVGDPGQAMDFVDHALRHGDSLLGVDGAQLEAFNWAPTGEPRLPLERATLEQAPACGRSCCSRRSCCTIARAPSDARSPAPARAGLRVVERAAAAAGGIHTPSCAPARARVSALSLVARAAGALRRLLGESTLHGRLADLRSLR
ncbi:MAG: hypothetical protein HC927_14020, partial [Deltaproteobacteria bacterium]|nr:hypothetical protein [Deltaproteobacteria bacterium]